MNDRKLDVVDELLTPDYIGHFPPHYQPEPVRGPDGYKKVVSQIHAGLQPEVTLEDIVSGQDKVVVRLRAQGAHVGAYQGIPATGRPVDFSVTITCRLVDGRIAESWSDVDAMGLMMQIGVVPPPGTGPIGLVGWVVRTIVRFGLLTARGPRHA